MTDAEKERELCARMLDRIALQAVERGKDFRPAEARKLKIAITAIRDCAQMVRERVRIDKEDGVHE